MTRIAIIARDAMDAEQARVYDAAKESGGPVGGPFYAYIRIPELFEKAQEFRAALGGGPLTTRERLIVLMVVARHWDARYPWYAQSRNALAAGIDRAVVDALNARAEPALDDAREQTCHAVARELMETNKLSDASYAKALDVMGEVDLIALVSATGQFVMTCCTANAFDVDPPADQPVPLA
jgi:4-carboxymuconolactone decarboxylase